MYRDEILASRQGNVERLFAKVGKENFDRLNELFRVFNKNFTNQEFQQVINDINSGIETEKTRLFYSLLNQRNIILDDMQKYETNNFSQKIENSKSI